VRLIGTLWERLSKRSPGQALLESLRELAKKATPPRLRQEQSVAEDVERELRASSVTRKPERGQNRKRPNAGTFARRAPKPKNQHV